MSRYNYFDDDPAEKQPKEKKLNIASLPEITITQPDFKSLGRKIRSKADDIVHNNNLRDIGESRILPALQSGLLKLLAFILFLVAIAAFILGFSHTINNQNKKNAQFSADAGKVCTEYLTKYGIVKWENLDSKEYGKGMTRLTGLCYARQMDFNNDGDDELMLCYNNKNIYTLEVWGYVDKKFTRLYSEEANRTENVKDGSWIAFYHKNNKYYICKSTPEEPNVVKLYSLKGDTFKEGSRCDYDYKDNIYSVKGKINAVDFETIKLSVIKSSKAELTCDIVTANIDSFHTVSLETINSQKTEGELKADAFYKVIEDRNTKYGKANIVTGKNKPYIDGLAVVDLIDFDGDENEELLLVYRKMVKQSATNYYTGEHIIIEEPTYCMEVYSWNGTVAKKIFTKDSVSNYMNDSSVNYVILQKNKNTVNICSNSYKYTDEYNYTASSRIYSCRKGSFDTAFSAREEVSYGYKSYYLDGEYTYSSQFQSNGFRVPKFLDDNGKYDDDKYRLIYLSGKDKADFDNTVNDTVKTIESLNGNYIAND